MDITTFIVYELLCLTGILFVLGVYLTQYITRLFEASFEHVIKNSHLHKVRELKKKIEIQNLENQLKNIK